MDPQSVPMDPQTVNVIYIIVGMALGLMGWVLYRAGLTVVGAIVGAAAGFALGFVIAAISGLAFLPFVMAVIGGFGGVWLMRKLHLLFFFVTGASLGGTTTYHLLTASGAISDPNALSLIILVAAGTLIGGFVFLTLRKFIIALVTAVFGALLFSIGLPADYAVLGLVVSLVVFLAVQIGLVRRYVRSEDFDERAQRQRAKEKRS